MITGHTPESQRRVKCPPATLASVKERIEAAMSDFSAEGASSNGRLVYNTAFSESIDGGLVVVGRVETSPVIGRLQLQGGRDEFGLALARSVGQICLVCLGLVLLDLDWFKQIHR